MITTIISKILKIKLILRECLLETELLIGNMMQILLCLKLGSTEDLFQVILGKICKTVTVIIQEMIGMTLYRQFVRKL
jgi:hypothetical protein